MNLKVVDFDEFVLYIVDFDLLLWMQIFFKFLLQIVDRMGKKPVIYIQSDPPINPPRPIIIITLH